MTKDLKRFEQWWDAGDDIPNDGPYTPDTPIQFAWAGWQAALAQPAPVQEPSGFFRHEDIYGDEVGPATPYYLIPSPPQRTWVGLTDKELEEFSDAKLGTYDLCLEVEAKLRSKNK